MGPVEITADNYTLTVTYPTMPVLVCAASRKAAQGRRFLHAAEELGQSRGDDLLVALLDVDAEPRIAEGLGAVQTPVAILIRNGYVQARTVEISGVQSLERFVDRTVARGDREADQVQSKRRGHWWSRGK